ncbi:MAG: hypothetical protein LC720_08245 [Actinobacteria bacterium]|nr:hypothetical protein [Actinomycetota bacterium]
MRKRSEEPVRLLRVEPSLPARAAATGEGAAGEGAAAEGAAAEGAAGEGA